MDISEVKVFPIQEEKLKAFVSIVFDHCFMVNDIKIIQGKDGLFISMPSRKKKNGEFKDVAHPLNNETRRMIETKILAEYERVLLERGETPAMGERPLAEDRNGDSGHAMAPMAQIAAMASVVPVVPIAPLAPEASLAAAGAADKTMEEIEEMHLRDSFWTVT
jgi:stage V sporulation protein G